MLDFADLANDVLSAYWPMLVRTTFSNRTMFDFASTPYAPSASDVTDGPEANVPRGLLRIEAPEGGLSDRIIVETSTTHAATDLTEFGVPGAAGNDTIVNAVPGTISKVIPIAITGFAQDAARMNSLDLINAVGQHFLSAFKALGDAINADLLGTGVNSLFGAMDSTTIYAGLDPAVFTQWAAYENTTGGLLTEAILEDVWTEVTGGNRRANAEDLVWLMETHQIRRYRAIGRMISPNAGVQKVRLADGGTLDLGYSGQEYNGRPILDLPDAPTTQVGLLNTAHVHIKEVRSLSVEVKPYAADGVLFYATWRGRLMYPNKHQSGKASGLTP